MLLCRVPRSKLSTSQIFHWLRAGNTVDWMADLIQVDAALHFPLMKLQHNMVRC